MINIIRNTKRISVSLKFAAQSISGIYTIYAYKLYEYLSN